MKINSILKLFSLVGFFSGLASTYENREIEEQKLRDIESSSAFNIIQDFREPKKILFSCLIGGSSHAHWVLSILNELDQRGHNTSYLTRGKYANFALKFPNIDTILLGPDYPAKTSVIKAGTNMTQVDSMVLSHELLARSFIIDYPRIFEIIRDGGYDVVMCDNINIPCIAAATKLKIPTVITSSMPLSMDAGAPYINNDFENIDRPTTQFMSFWERFYVKLILPHEFVWKSRYYLLEQKRMAKLYGTTVYFRLRGLWKNHVKIHNTAFGFHFARPLGPLVEFVGPIIKATIPELHPDLAAYLDQHRRVVYIGFGTLTYPKKGDIALIITGLLEAYEKKEIDGFIWATGGKNKDFPAQLTTESGKTYTLFDESNTDFIFPNWAPQMAILNHPSVMMFVTHGGSSSLYESLYSGVRMVIFPMFSDQPAAALKGEINGYALKISGKMTQKEANEVISRVARDDNQTFQKNVNRFKALVQIRSKSGVIKGADIVEEVAFLSVDGFAQHRRDVREDISFLKATNYDIYAVAALIVGGVVGSVIWLFVNIGYYIMSIHSQAQKIKKL